MKKVKISTIIEAIDFESDETRAYLNLETNEVIYPISELDKECSWAKGLKTKEELEHDDNYIILPSKHDFHEHKVMVDFSHMQEESVTNELLSLLYTKGAFKNFKNTIYRHKIQNKWYEYKTSKLIEFAVNWCSENNVIYEQ